jgi:parvulin-like peptidyl-prolyl isomerase
VRGARPAERCPPISADEPSIAGGQPVEANLAASWNPPDGVVLVSRSGEEVAAVAMKYEGKDEVAADAGYRTLTQPGGVAMGGCQDGAPVGLTSSEGEPLGLVALFCVEPGEHDTVVVMFDEPQALAARGVHALRFGCSLCPEDGHEFALDLSRLPAVVGADHEPAGTAVGPEQVRSRHILLRVDEERSSEQAREQLAALRARLAAGEDFAFLAAEVSEDPGSAAQGGDLGFFGRGQMVPEFEEAAFAAQVGELVGPVETSFGLHLIEVIERRPGGDEPR